MRIGFSTNRALISAIIRKMTNSKSSHSYIVFEAAGEELVIQANVHGVCCEHYKNFKKKQKIIAEYDLLITTEQERSILSFALKKLLLPYDYLALIGFIWILLNKKIGRKVKQPFERPASYFCSELVISALQAANFPMSHGLDTDTTSPEDIMDFLDAHLGAKLVYGSHHQ